MKKLKEVIKEILVEETQFAKVIKEPKVEPIVKQFDFSNLPRTKAALERRYLKTKSELSDIKNEIGKLQDYITGSSYAGDKQHPNSLYKTFDKKYGKTAIRQTPEVVQLISDKFSVNDQTAKQYLARLSENWSTWSKEEYDLLHKVNMVFGTYYDDKYGQPIEYKIGETNKAAMKMYDTYSDVFDPEILKQFKDIIELRNILKTLEVGENNKKEFGLEDSFSNNLDPKLIEIKTALDSGEVDSDQFEEYKTYLSSEYRKLGSVFRDDWREYAKANSRSSGTFGYKSRENQIPDSITGRTSVELPNLFGGKYSAEGNTMLLLKDLYTKLTKTTNVVRSKKQSGPTANDDIDILGMIIDRLNAAIPEIVEDDFDFWKMSIANGNRLTKDAYKKQAEWMIENKDSIADKLKTKYDTKWLGEIEKLEAAKSWNKFLLPSDYSWNTWGEGTKIYKQMERELHLPQFKGDKFTKRTADTEGYQLIQNESDENIKAEFKKIIEGKMETTIKKIISQMKDIKVTKVVDTDMDENLSIFRGNGFRWDVETDQGDKSIHFRAIYVQPVDKAAHWRTILTDRKR